MSFKEYVLGTQRDELARLGFQHTAWLQQQYAVLHRAGVRAGQIVLDLGCGPGFTSFELAQFVGAKGKVIACDQSASFLEFLAAESARRCLPQIEARKGPVEKLSLAQGSVDGAYARWLFCWLPDPGAVLERIAAFVRPGGAIVLQEYLDWSAVRHCPRDERFDRLVAACMRSWRDASANMEVAGDFPALADRAGLVVEHFQPIARAGRVGSLEWRWTQEFFESYVPKLVERGLISEHEVREGLATVRSRGADDPRIWIAPVMADVVLRKR